MTTEQAKAFVRHHFEEFVNNKNHDVVSQTLSDDFLDHDGPNGRPTDRDGDRRLMIAMHEQVPDLHLTIEDMIAERDKVVCRNVWRGTTKAASPSNSGGS
jgi:predicted ester cyclase